MTTARLRAAPFVFQGLYPHETAIYAVGGTSCMWCGEHLEHRVVVEPGNFLYFRQIRRTCLLTRATRSRWWRRLHGTDPP